MTYVTSDMRQILIDWIVDVHQSFELKEQTLHLALAYLNQYSALVEISKHDYQLVGITCLWIASKYEEIYPPRMQNYIQVTDSSYSAHELKAMEGKILLALNFNLNYTTPLQILEAVSEKWVKEPNGKLSRESQRTLCMCKYLIELSLF
jgi:Cyclin, N-terminal domain